MNHSGEQTGIPHWFRVDGRPIRVNIFAVSKIETLLRFKDEDDYETRFDLKFFRVFSKYGLPGKLHFTIFH